MSGKIRNAVNEGVLCSNFVRIENTRFSQGRSIGIPEFPRGSFESFWSSKIAFDGVLRNTDFPIPAPIGPSPGTSGRVLGSGALPSRAAGFFSLLLHDAKHSSFILLRFKNPGWGRSGDQTPCTRRPLGDPFWDTFFEIPSGLDRPRPTETHQKLKNDLNKPLNLARCPGNFGAR